MPLHKLLVTRQLAGYSGDLYINVDSIHDFQNLYKDIMSGVINRVNGEPCIADKSGLKVRFKIIDCMLNKFYDAHIKNNVGDGIRTGDGLRFTLTKYIKDLSVTPSQFLTISLEINDNTCSLLLYTNFFYKYILEKHATENLYRITMDEVPDKYPKIERISETTNTYLEKFNIICTNNKNLKWQRTKFISYKYENGSKKYIGVPYSTELELNEFDSIEEIL